jgi:hypothetical protein
MHSLLITLALLMPMTFASSDNIPVVQRNSKAASTCVSLLSLWLNSTDATEA